jgi:hypothetical protein
MQLNRRPWYQMNGAKQDLVGELPHEVLFLFKKLGYVW